MKKILAVLSMTIILSMGLTACGNNSGQADSGHNATSAPDSNGNLSSEDYYLEDYNARNSDSYIDRNSVGGYYSTQSPPVTNPNNDATPYGMDTSSRGSVPANPSSSGTTATAKKPSVTTKSPVTTAPSTSSDNAFVSEVVRLVNIEREKAGVNPLSMSTALNQAAAVRSNEIISSFSHTRPNGTSFATVLSELNISYKTAGENIAGGQSTPQEVVEGWMNSPGHRANILNASYTKIGVGYVTGGSYRTNWTQLFTG